MTFAGSIPTSSTNRSPAASATPSWRSPGRRACSSAGTRARRPSRWWPPSPRARRSPGPTSSTWGWRPPTSATSPPARSTRPAAMFTASHNPAEYNGVKLCRAGALPIGQDTGLAEIKAMVAGGLLERAEDPGRTEQRDLLPAFVAHVHSFVDLDALRPLRVVADTANGVGGLIVPAVFAGLPFELTAPLRRARRHVPEPPRRPHRGREPEGPPARRPRHAGRRSGSRSTGTPTASSSSTTSRSRCRAPPPPRCWRRRSSTSTRARRSCTT